MSTDPAELAILAAELEADQAELTLRDEIERTAIRRLGRAAGNLDAVDALRVRCYFHRLAGELALRGEAEASDVTDACARFVVAAAVSFHGLAALDRMHLTLRDA